jgi:poly(A) polymerase
MRGCVRELLHISRSLLSSKSEKEAERLLMFIVKDSPFRGRVFTVGGYVRDELLGLDAKDLDIVVEMKGGAEKLTAMIHRMFPVETSTPRRLGAGYPIWHIAFKDDINFQGDVFATNGAEIDFADTQKETFPDADSRQRVVEYGTLQEDIERRDLTVNMLLKDLTSGEIMDLTGVSRKDLKEGVLRGHPGVDFDKILREDPLRMIRLVRFQVKYGWTVPMETLRAVKRNVARIRIVSGERIRDELIKIMDMGKLAQAVRIMKATGLLKYVFPEIQAMQGVEHEYTRGCHMEGDVLRHTLLVLQNAKPGVENQLGALLHDVGKPDSQEVVGGLIRFIGHDKVGGEIAEGILRRLKFDSSVVKRVRTMVENHMRPHLLVRDDNAGPAALRRFIRDVGTELVTAVLDLAEADQLGTLPPTNMIPDLRQQIDALMIPVQQAESLPVDGKDIQKILGVGPGKMIGDALKFLKDKKFEMGQDGKEMTREDAEKLILKKFG